MNIFLVAEKFQRRLLFFSKSVLHPTTTVQTGTFISWYVCHWLWYFPGKAFLICDQNFFDLFMLSLSTLLWWFDLAFLIFLLHLFLKVLFDFQSLLDLDFLAFLNVWSPLFINYLVSISSHGHSLPFTRFSIWGACVSKTSSKDDVEYCTTKSTSVSS